MITKKTKFSIDEICAKWKLDEELCFIIWLIKENYNPTSSRQSGEDGEKRNLTFTFNPEKCAFEYENLEALVIWQFLRRHPDYIQKYNQYKECKSKEKKEALQHKISKDFFLRVPIDPQNFFDENICLIYHPFFPLMRGIPVSEIKNKEAQNVIILNSFINPTLVEKAMSHFIKINRTVDEKDRRIISQLLTFENLYKCLYILYFEVKQLNPKNSATTRSHFRELFGNKSIQPIQISRINANLEKIFQNMPTIFFS